MFVHSIHCHRERQSPEGAGRPENRKERERIALENNRRANDPVLNRSEMTVARAEFSAELETPSTISWSNVVRA
jgi:hypothetical protein